MLLLLRDGPAHGYTLLGALTEFGLGETDPSAVYRALRDMEGRGWVTSSWDPEETQGPPRRVYRLTSLSDDVLAQWAQDLQETYEMIDRLLSAFHRGRSQDADSAQ